MFDLIEKLDSLAKLNFCEDCYSKFQVLISGEIEYLLSEPISDWRQTERNIDLMWIKAKGFYKVVDTGFVPHENAFKKAERESIYCKLKFLKKTGVLQSFTYKFLDQVKKRRNKIHASVIRPSKFTKHDYLLFREAKAITDSMRIPIIHDIKDNRRKIQLANVEKYAKQLLDNPKLF